MAKNKYHKQCSFCEDKTTYIDYKNIKLITPFLSKYAKIVPKYYSGVCLRHQKMLARSVKKARIVALIPFVR